MNEISFFCLRCSTTYANKSNYKKHLNKNKECEYVLLNISKEECLELLTLKKEDYGNKVSVLFYNKLLKNNNNNQLQLQLEDQIREKDRQIAELIKKVGNNVTINTCTKDEYVYMIKPRASVESNLSVYKIGRTNNLNLRFQQYAKGGEIKYVYPCHNSKELEKTVLETFKEKFSQRPDFGREYFEGNFDEMADTFKNILK